MIEVIRFKNCQAFTDTTMEFATDRLNVIVADNDTGKSILFRILKLAGDADYYDAQDRADLIRRGCDYARVMFKFTDDSYALMQIEKSLTKYAFMPTAKSKVELVFAPPPEMIEHLELLVSPGQSFVANLIDKEQDQLLVNPKLQSNYDLVKLIATNEDLDNLMERTDARIKDSRQKLIRASDLENFLQRELSSLEYTDVHAMEENLQAVDAVDKALNALCTVIVNLDHLIDSKVDFLDYQKLECVLKVLEKLEGLQLPVKLPKLTDPRFFRVLERLELLLKNAEKIQKLTVPCSENLLLILEKLQTMQSSADNLKRLMKPPNEKLVIILEKLQAMDREISRVRNLGQPLSLSLIKVLEVLRQVERQAGRISIPDISEITVLEKQFKESGQVVECPIYGEVVFDGKNCMADSI